MATLLKSAQHMLPKMQILTYQDVFRRLKVPAGTLVFTDFDWLSALELDAVSAIASSVPTGTRILNHPNRAMERFEVLKTLQRELGNPVAVSRLDEGVSPTQFPVFIRSEDGARGPESGILKDIDAFNLALDEMRESGPPIKRRVVLTFQAERQSNRHYRKYGAFRIGEHIIPQHILRSEDWNVKRDSEKMDASFIDEEFAFVSDNPHENEAMKRFRACSIEFGRMDYGFVDGKMVTYEINTNPTFPHFSRKKNDGRDERRAVLSKRLTKAFDAISCRSDVAKGFSVDLPHHTLKHLQYSRWGIVRRRLWKWHAK